MLAPKARWPSRSVRRIVGNVIAKSLLGLFANGRVKRDPFRPLARAKTRHPALAVTRGIWFPRTHH